MKNLITLALVATATFAQANENTIDVTFLNFRSSAESRIHLVANKGPWTIYGFNLQRSQPSFQLEYGIRKDWGIMASAEPGERPVYGLWSAGAHSMGDLRVSGAWYLQANGGDMEVFSPFTAVTLPAGNHRIGLSGTLTVSNKGNNLGWGPCILLKNGVRISWNAFGNRKPDVQIAVGLRF